MPKQVLPTAEEFAVFFNELEWRSFRRITSSESRLTAMRLGLVAPSPRDGREVGYTYTANGLTVCVWTTYDAVEGCARDSDAGWVLIAQGDRVKYFSRPIHRTKNFLRNLLGHARIARTRVMHRPLCPTCRRMMDITLGQGLKSRYWSCAKHNEHQSWDLGLGPEALAFVERYRKEHARYRARVRAAGREPGAALAKRRGWSVTRPENRVP